MSKILSHGCCPLAHGVRGVRPPNNPAVIPNGPLVLSPLDFKSECPQESSSPLPSPSASVSGVPTQIQHLMSPVPHSIPPTLTSLSAVSLLVDTYPPPASPVAPIHRSKSLPSLVNSSLSNAPSAGAGIITPTLLGQPMSFPIKESANGFRCFVQRIGLNGGNNTSSCNQTDPRAQDSAKMSGTSSSNSSPNISVDDGKEISLPSSPNEHEEVDLSHRSPHSQRHAYWPTQVTLTNSSASQRFFPAFSTIGLGFLATLKLSKKKQPLSASKALGGGGPKRKLCISGVPLEDVRAMERVKAWCESFGEVKEMSRSADGTLLVDFKKARVAETVCRIQARVYIKGVGSVVLSWRTKKKPTFSFRIGLFGLASAPQHRFSSTSR